MFMPNLSFCGHLAGITTGTLQLYGLLDCIMVTDVTFLREMEEYKLVKWLSSSHPGFVPTPASIDMARYDSASLCQAMRRGGYAVLRFVGHVFQAVWVIIFGRGSAPNANIQLRSLMSVSEDMESGDYDAADDEEWNGLPEERVVSQQLV
jgi:hypothetical protein